MDILENRLGELTLKWHLTCKGVEKDVVKKLMVPLPDENGYFTIKGNKYLLVYQLLEASTYVSKNTVSLKSLQAVALDRVAKQYKAMNGLTYTCPIFNLQMFKNPVPSLLFYLANFGFKNTLTFFNVNDSIRIICVGDDMDTKLCKENNIDHVKSLNDIDDLYEERKYIYFPISKKILIRVNSKIFHKYNYVQSIVGMLKELTTNRLTLEELCDRDFWLEKLDYINSKNAKKMDLNNTSSDKGLSTLIHFSRMLDETNKKNLKLNLYHRENIYSIVRWLITEYDNPAEISPIEAPSFCACFTFEFINTVHLVPRSTGLEDSNASFENSTAFISTDLAYVSINEPHPEEQASFNIILYMAPSLIFIHFIS